MSSFKIQFDISDYSYKKGGVVPPLAEYLKHDEIINYREHEKGNIDNCIWKRHEPTIEEISSTYFREREITRILKTGAWVAIKDTVVWLPPSLYFALAYVKAGDEPMQFRLKRLKHSYFKLSARKNPACAGTFTVKNRQDGETTMAMIDGFWECLDGNMNVGQIGVQSKTRSDAFNPCWMTLQGVWQGIPKWLKDELCDDFSSGDNIAEKIRFMRNADEEKGVSARNIIFQYYPAVYNAMDGKNNMRRCILDEVLKWVECDFGDSLTNYFEFIMPGFERRGMFDMFSSPADKECKSYRDGHQLWKDSDPKEINESTGTTKSRIHRWYSNPLEGVHGAYDKWGDADPDKIYDLIMQERKNCPKDKLMEKIRAKPLNDEEIWGALDSSDFWDNSRGIAARKVYLIGHRFKDEKTKEPTVVFGNLEWPDGIKDEIDPVFRMADKSEFDVYDARFCFSYLPVNNEPLRNIKRPPSYVENCLGIDSVDKRYPGQRPSDLAMVNHKFRDIFQTGIVKCPTMLYLNRPMPIEIAYEDAIKAAVFCRALVQVESLNSNIVNYFEDRGYIEWMLSKIGQPKNSLIKGDAPSGKNSAFIDEIIGMINSITNLPLHEGDKYLLELNWLYHLLDDVSKFNKKDTHRNNATMAWGQGLMGAAKILFKKVRQTSDLNGAVMEFLIG